MTRPPSEAKAPRNQYLARWLAEQCDGAPNGSAGPWAAAWDASAPVLAPSENSVYPGRR
jgi:hypothetical protein